MNSQKKTSTQFPKTRSHIPIKAYKKGDLQLLIMNPNIDLTNELEVSQALRMHPRKWNQLCEEKLKGKVPESEWKHAFNLKEPVVRLLLEPTFKLVSNSNSAGIKCLICNNTSFNPNDVEYKFCGHCNKFHEY